MTDAELLEQHHQGSRPAFEQLVQRHVHWVHSIAKRRVRDSHLAEDVTQATFIVLARKAPRLKAGQALSTWLFPVANFASKQVLRVEHRRRMREIEAAKMQKHIDLPQQDQWNELAVMLDELVGRLRRADRQAVLLRFYEQKSFPEIGQILQISEEAARKRVSRAVERLRESFAGRGIPMGATALATVMTANLIQPASATVITSASASAGSSALGPVVKAIHGMMLWTSLKPVALAAGVLMIAALAATFAQIAPKPNPPVAAAPTTAPSTQPARMHFGVVINRQGAAVPNAKIWAVDVRSDVVAMTTGLFTSDAQGKFQIGDDPGVRSRTIMVQAPGYGFGAGGMLFDSEFDPSEIQMPPAGRLRFRLVDMEGKPVAGMSVTPMDMLMPQPNQAVAILPREVQDLLARTTDADGVCTLEQLPRGAQLALEVRDTRFAHPRFIGRTKMTDSEFTDVGTIQLKPSASISGKVVYEDSGKPLAGLEINVFPTSAGSGNMSRAQTDANGVYRIDQLSPTDYVIRPNWRAIHDPYAIISYKRVAVGLGEQVTGKDMPLVLGGTIRGKITAEATGAPVPDVLIMVIGPMGNGEREWSLSARTDSGGEYSISAPPGKQLIDCGRFSVFGKSDLLPAKPENVQVEVAVGQTISADFKLPPRPGLRAAGKVVDAEGHPLMGVYVTVEQPNGAPAVSRRGNVSPPLADTDEQGRFTLIGVNDGDVLRARKAPRWMTSEPLTISAANRNDARIVMRKSQWATVLVRAKRDDTNAPVAGAKVQVYSNGDTLGLRLVSENLLTAADGSCLIEQLYPDTQYTIRISADGLSMGSIENLSLSANNRTEPPPVVLSKAESSISGMLVDPDSQPVANVEVVMSGTRTASQKVYTDITGRFQFKNVMAGDTLSVYATRNSFRTRTQEIPAGSDSIIITFRAPQGM